MQSGWPLCARGTEEGVAGENYDTVLTAQQSSES